MNIKVCSILLCGFLLGCADRKPAGNPSSANSPATTPQSATPVQSESKSEVKNEPNPEFQSQPSSAKGRVDACALIAKSEISAVQGEAVQEMKSNSRVAGPFLMTQCFYQLPTFHNSISLEVTQRDPSNPGQYGPKDRWQELFHAKEKDKPKGKEKDSGKPLKVAGVGDEAFWVGDRISGALYVLKGSAYFRVSIGGPHEQSVRVTKSKTLAQKALARL